MVRGQNVTAPIIPNISLKKGKIIAMRVVNNTNVVLHMSLKMLMLCDDPKNGMFIL